MEKFEYPLKYANRHGLIAGSTGTGKTYTVAGLIEHFSNNGTPVIAIDAKGDLSSLSKILPSRLIDPFINWQTSIKFIGPSLFARTLNLSPIQTQVLQVIFKMADDNNLPLDTLDDFSEVIRIAGLNLELIAEKYGPINGSTLQYIRRALIKIDKPCFFGSQSCPSKFMLSDSATNALKLGKMPEDLRGNVTFLQSIELIKNPELYAAWIISILNILYEGLEEQGDIEAPVLAFFIDEAHLLFKGISPALFQDIERIVRLIRSKGVSLWFASQSPSDIPSEILSQLGNRIQHGLRGATIQGQRAVRAAATTMPHNPAIDAVIEISRLKVGQALYSFISEDGTPAPVQIGQMIPPSVPLEALHESELPQKVVAIHTLTMQDIPKKRRWWFNKD